MPGAVALPGLAAPGPSFPRPGRAPRRAGRARGAGATRPSVTAEPAPPVPPTPAVAPDHHYSGGRPQRRDVWAPRRRSACPRGVAEAPVKDAAPASVVAAGAPAARHRRRCRRRAQPCEGRRRRRAAPKHGTHSTAREEEGRAQELAYGARRAQVRERKARPQRLSPRTAAARGGAERAQLKARLAANARAVPEPPAGAAPVAPAKGAGASQSKPTATSRAAHHQAAVRRVSRQTVASASQPPAPRGTTGEGGRRRPSRWRKDPAPRTKRRQTLTQPASPALATKNLRQKPLPPKKKEEVCTDFKARELDQRILGEAGGCVGVPVVASMHCTAPAPPRLHATRAKSTLCRRRVRTVKAGVQGAGVPRRHGAVCFRRPFLCPFIARRRRGIDASPTLIHAWRRRHRRDSDTHRHSFPRGPTRHRRDPRNSRNTGPEGPARTSGTRTPKKDHEPASAGARRRRGKPRSPSRASPSR